MHEKEQREHDRSREIARRLARLEQNEVELRERLDTIERVQSEIMDMQREILSRLPKP
jgi:hypothetical protein